MAKNNHYTSDHWKVGGDGFSGENVLHEVNKQKYAQAQKTKFDSIVRSVRLQPDRDRGRVWNIRRLSGSESINN